MFSAANEIAFIFAWNMIVIFQVVQPFRIFQKHSSTQPSFHDLNVGEDDNARGHFSPLLITTTMPSHRKIWKTYFPQV